MTAWRTSGGTAIDRGKPIEFNFDGVSIKGFQGDTIASALLANDVSVVGRSFKYHRPRGIWGSGVEEPNAIVDIQGRTFHPNSRATTELATGGLFVRSVNSRPSARSDRNAFIDSFSKFIPAAFYYKTFMFPDWQIFEPRIRSMAGLGSVRADGVSPPASDQINHRCDLVVVGTGPTGLATALAAAKSGRRVLVCDQGDRVGGSLLSHSATIDGISGTEWASAAKSELEALGAIVLLNTTAFGIYDHLMIALDQRLSDGTTQLWRVRPDRIVLATGAIERPLPFANNDLPGVMSQDAALTYLRRYGVAAGRRIVVATNNGAAYETARALKAEGVEVAVIDYRTNRATSDLTVFGGLQIVRAFGRNRVEAVELSDGRRLQTDAVLVSGGFTPTIHLFCQAQGKLEFNEEKLALVPKAAVPGISVVGAAAGAFSMPELKHSVSEVLSSNGIPTERLPLFSGYDDGGMIAAWPKHKMKGRVWIDLQNDVTAKDVELAARENFVSVEHLKRYTTLGMATDQGKTSNLAGLALMAEITGRRIPEVGTTTYRPPFTPVSFQTLAGHRSKELFNPVRRLPLESSHRRDGAVFQEYGGWLRPAWYGDGDADARTLREVRMARHSVALFDGTPLGKIEVIGPQAAEFLDFVYYNTVSNLKPGRCRYGFILAESGIIYDDGVLVRIDENHFIVSCSSSHVTGMHALLEEWRQDRFDRNRVFIHNATAESATLTVSGPRSKVLLEKARVEADLSDDALPHMATTTASFSGIDIRVTRVSFTGDRSYELAVPSAEAETVWSQLKTTGEELEAGLIGVEALMILRAEKGYIVVGKDSDGMSRPMDFGLVAPLEKKKVEFIGRRSLLTPEAQRLDRQQFVGLEVLDDGPPLATGAHGVETQGREARSIGYVTSSYFSPTLDRPIALGLMERGSLRHGEIITIQHLGAKRQARIAPPCALDPEGTLLNA